MTTAQKQQISIYALLANLVISGATLTYVRDTEHRITTLEDRIHSMTCELKLPECARAP